jgi:hypoxanthine phosphoribosyltransferase
MSPNAEAREWRSIDPTGLMGADPIVRASFAPPEPGRYDPAMVPARSAARPRVLYSRRRIARRVGEIARAVDRAYRGRPFTICGVLTGGAVFAVDLARAVRNDRVEIDFVKASSYGKGTVSSGRVELTVLDQGGIVGKDVLVVEDIFESGRTLLEVVKGLRVCGARTVRTAVLLVKPGMRVADLEPDWVGFTMEEDSFVAGYGLDAGKRWRNLPDIVVPPIHDGRRKGRVRGGRRSGR